MRLVTLDDNVVTIPNNKFLTDMVSSGNWGALDMQIQMDFFIGADQDVPLAKRLDDGPAAPALVRAEASSPRGG